MQTALTFEIYNHNRFGIKVTDMVSLIRLIENSRARLPDVKPPYTQVSNEPLVMYANHGRWVVDCQCGAGNIVEPSWRQTACLACGRIHTTVIVPDNLDEIERVLHERVRTANQNFDPRKSETVTSLRAENALAPPGMVNKVRVKEKK